MTDEEKQQAEALKAFQQMRDDFRALMAVRSNRRVVWHLLGQCGIFRTSLSSDAIQMAASEGMRSMGLQILDMINMHCPEQYDTMAREAREPTEGNK